MGNILRKQPQVYGLTQKEPLTNKDIKQLTFVGFTIEELDEMNRNTIKEHTELNRKTTMKKNAKIRT